MKIDLKISAFEFVKIVSQCFQGSNSNSNILIKKLKCLTEKKCQFSYDQSTLSCIVSISHFRNFYDLWKKNFGGLGYLSGL